MSEELTEREKFLVRATMRQTADMIADQLETMSREPGMRGVSGSVALRAAAVAARNTNAKVWPEGLA